MRKTLQAGAFFSWLYKAFILIEDGNKIHRGTGRSLIKPGKAQSNHVFLNAGVFAVRNAPLKHGNAHIVAWDILLHEADRNALGQCVMNPVEQMQALARAAGQDQVADEHAAAHDAVA